MIAKGDLERIKKKKKGRGGTFLLQNMIFEQII